MRKIFSVVMCLTMAFSIAACGKSGVETPREPEPTQTVIQNETQEATIQGTEDNTMGPTNENNSIELVPVQPGTVYLLSEEARYYDNECFSKISYSYNENGALLEVEVTETESGETWIQEKMNITNTEA